MADRVDCRGRVSTLVTAQFEPSVDKAFDIPALHAVPVGQLFLPRSSESETGHDSKHRLGLSDLN
jgi:hypothetical protein